MSVTGMEFTVDPHPPTPSLDDRLRLLRADFDAGFADDPETVSPHANLHLTLELGVETLAIPVGAVVRMVRGVDVVPLPGAQAHLLGVVNIGGELITVYDFAQVLGIPLTDAPDGDVVILRGPRFIAGFLVTRIGALVSCESGPDTAASVRQNPVSRPTGSGDPGHFQAAVYHDGVLLQLPNLGALFESLDARS